MPAVAHDSEIFLDVPNRLATTALFPEKPDIVRKNLMIVARNQFKERGFSASVRPANEPMLARLHFPVEIRENEPPVPADIDMIHFDEAFRFFRISLQNFSFFLNLPQLAHKVRFFLLARLRFFFLALKNHFFVFRLCSAKRDFSFRKFKHIRNRFGDFVVAFHSEYNSRKRFRTIVRFFLFSYNCRKKFKKNRAALSVESCKRIAQNQKFFTRKQSPAQQCTPNFTRRHKFKPAVKNIFDTAEFYFGKRLKPVRNRGQWKMTVL